MTGRSGASWVGLCTSCLHARVVETRRGSRFYLCNRAKTDPRFRKYPPLPMLRCPGFELGEPRNEPSSAESPE